MRREEWGVRRSDLRGVTKRRDERRKGKGVVWGERLEEAWVVDGGWRMVRNGDGRTCDAVEALKLMRSDGQSWYIYTKRHEQRRKDKEGGRKRETRSGKCGTSLYGVGCELITVCPAHSTHRITKRDVHG